jgi:hypothetical protein
VAESPIGEWFQILFEITGAIVFYDLMSTKTNAPKLKSLRKDLVERPIKAADRDSSPLIGMWLLPITWYGPHSDYPDRSNLGD